MSANDFIVLIAVIGSCLICTIWMFTKATPMVSGMVSSTVHSVLQKELREIRSDAPREVIHAINPLTTPLNPFHNHTHVSVSGLVPPPPPIPQ